MSKRQAGDHYHSGLARRDHTHPSTDHAHPSYASSGHTHAVQLAAGFASVPSLILGASTTVQVTIAPAYPNTAYLARAVLTGSLSLLAALEIQAVNVFSGSRVDVTIKNTGLITLSGGEVIVFAIPSAV